MAANNTVESLDAMFKTIYGPKLKNLVPDNARLIKRFPYVDKMGKDYRVPVVLTSEQGVTYGDYTEDALTLNASSALAMGDAIVYPYQIVMRATLGYNAASRAASSGKAFEAAMTPIVKSLMDTMSFRVETSMLYGQVGLGTTSSSANASATSTVITISTATWAAGIWGGCLENARIAVFFADRGALIDDLTISAISFANRTLTVTGNATDIANLDTYIAETGGAGEIFWHGSHGTRNACVGVHKECAGLDKIVTNTGTLFNISASTYSAWKGNSYAVSGALTQAKLSAAITDAAARGLNSDAMILISPATWSNLMTDQAALRKYDSSYAEKGKNGFKALQFYMLNGMNEVVAHPCVKQGEGFIIPVSQDDGMATVQRVGAYDISMENPVNKDQFFIDLEGKTAVELRAYSNQAIFCDAPCKMTKLTAITNT